MMATETKVVNSEIIKEIEEKIENVYSYLNKQKEYVNSLNVFPVPDGDTGLNMVLTIQGAIAALRSNNGYSSMTPGKFLKNFAENMLLNSRGCSGVILSLFAQGFTQVTENNDFSKENIYKAIENGYRNAYEGTENPKEGTMLTIMKALKEKYYELMQTEDDPVAIINNTLPYLREVLDKTPDMLPVLKQAGVVDSGAAGFIILLEGINKELNHHNNFNNISVPILLNLGKTTRKLLNKRLSKFKKSSYFPLILNIDTTKIHNLRLREVLQNARNLLSNNLHHNGKNTLQEQIINDLQQIDESWNPDIKYKFCTEFVLETDVVSSKEELKDKLKDYGDSLIIVNSDNKYKVHIHTNKPNDIFSDMSKFGELLFTKVDDMKKQHRNFISDDIIDYEKDKSIFCIVSGKGFAEILQNMGADDILCYGKNKPSVNQLVKSLNNLKAKNIIVAADDSDILMALKYAVTLCKSNVLIVESDNPISLISIMVNISKDYDVHTIFDMAMNSLHDIRFCAIAKSTRDIIAEGGTPVKKNDFFAVYKKKIILANKNLEPLIVEIIQQLANDSSLITIYKGIRAKKEENITGKLKEQFPSLEFEEYFGGQYKYDYYITFE